MWKNIGADLEHSAALWGLTRSRRLIAALAKVALYPRVRAVLWFRLSHVLWTRQATRPLALLVQGHVIKTAGAEIHPAASIGPGLNLAHSVGVVVGHEVVAGRNLLLYQNVTIGHGPRPGQARLGDEVHIFAGATILGGVTIGDRARIGAGAVVMADVEPGSVVRGPQS